MWDYKKDPDYTTAIRNADISALRSFVCGVLMDDPADSNGMAVKLLADIQRKVPGVMDPHAKTPEIQTDRSRWTIDYRDRMAGMLYEDFSQGLFDHVVEVGKHVFGATPEACISSAGTSGMKRDRKKKRGFYLGCSGIGAVAGILLIKSYPIRGLLLTITSVAVAVTILNRRQGRP